VNPSQINVLVEMGTDRWTIVSAVAVYLALRFMTRVIETTRSRKAQRFWLRVLPIAPELIGVPAALFKFIPSVAAENAVMRIALGLWVAYLAQKAHKLLGQTVLGADDRIAETTRPAVEVRRGRRVDPMGAVDGGEGAGEGR